MPSTARRQVVSDWTPWLYGILVVAIVALALWIVFRRRRPLVTEDGYTKALELWLANDLEGARTRFRDAIDKQPDAVDPYLQLGNLLRQMGDAQRAAVLHRSLTVRQDIPREKRVSITLSLAEDLLAIRQWQEAGEVLDSLKTIAATSARYWRARFSLWVGMGRKAEAAQALRTASHMCDDTEGKLFKDQYAYFQVDRALRETRGNRLGEARRILKDIPRGSPAATKVTYVRALIAAQEGDAEKAISTATEGLLESPLEMTIFLPTLQEALLDSGQYTRSLTILESVCQAETAPPSLWVALAMLYEKLDRRDDAIGLLERKANDPRLTPNAAAPFLKLLASEQAGSDLGRVWRALHVPTVLSAEWICSDCGAKRSDIHWFCPDCHGFNSFKVERRREGKLGASVS